MRSATHLTLVNQRFFDGLQSRNPTTTLPSTRFCPRKQTPVFHPQKFRTRQAGSFSLLRSSTVTLPEGQSKLFNPTPAASTLGVVPELTPSARHTVNLRRKFGEHRKQAEKQEGRPLPPSEPSHGKECGIRTSLRSSHEELNISPDTT